jgi:hypothetical protein
MTRITIGRGTRVLPTDMAVRALHIDVRAGQRECRLTMVKVRGCPCARAVADLAGLWEPSRHVIRIGGAVEVRQVTRYARCAQARILAAGMARVTSLTDVRAGQRECSC